MKLLSAIAASILIGASLISGSPSKADNHRPNTPSVDFLAGNYAGGFCLYKTGFMEEDAIFARVNDAGQDTGMTPEEVQKMMSSPAFMPIVNRIISENSGCIELSNMQFRAWDVNKKATQIVR